MAIVNSREMQAPAFRELSVNQVRQWFLLHKDGKFAGVYPCFDDLDGEDLCSLSHEQVQHRCPKKGDILFNLFQRLVNAPTESVIAPLPPVSQVPEPLPPPYIEHKEESTPPLPSVVESQEFPPLRNAKAPVSLSERLSTFAATVQVPKRVIPRPSNLPKLPNPELMVFLPSALRDKGLAEYARVLKLSFGIYGEGIRILSSGQFW